jgi:hypothetical protein
MMRMQRVYSMMMYGVYDDGVYDDFLSPVG